MPKKGPLLLFRGLHAAIWHDEDSNRELLEHYLGRLGIRVTTHTTLKPLPQDVCFDLLFFDSDHNLPIEDLNIDLPMIALVGSEAPSRLQSILANNSASMIFKPIRSAGVYGSIVFAVNRFEEQRAMQAQQERLNSKIKYRKVVIFAMLKLMRKQDCTEDVAFSILRKQAMERRITIEALCAEMAAL
jgi:AmiR/NasT family two-component response regulator